MTSTWGNWHGSWQRSDAGDDGASEAVDDEDPVQLAKWLAERDLTLIQEGDTDDKGGRAGLVLEFDEGPAVVAFTSMKYANAFAGEHPELFGDPPKIKGFLIEGQGVVQETPAEFGLLIDPGSEEERYLSPQLLEQIRRELAPLDLITKAIADGDAASLATWLRSTEFWLIEEPRFSDNEGMAAFVLKVDENPAVAAFTSQQRASEFLGTNLHQFENRKQFTSFVVSGETVVTSAGTGAGVIIDMETEDVRYLSPELVERIRAVLTR